MNKKGNIEIIIMFVGILFIILFLGFMMAVGSSLLNWIFDIAAPELSSLGSVGATNFTEIASYTITPANNIIQNFTWMTGVLYVMMLIGSLGMAFVVRTSPSKWLIGFYFLTVLILILGAIFMSNIYEDFYDDSGDLGSLLREHKILSYMILYSPSIFTFLAFIMGIILFSGMTEEAVA